MTLRELKKLHILASDTYIYIHRINGNEGYVLTLDNSITIKNVDEMFNKVTLDREINFIQPTENAIIVYFKEN